MKRKRILIVIAIVFCVVCLTEGILYTVLAARLPFLTWSNSISVDALSVAGMNYGFQSGEPFRTYTLTREEVDQVISLLNQLSPEKITFYNSGRAIGVDFLLYLEGNGKRYILKSYLQTPEPLLYVSEDDWEPSFYPDLFGFRSSTFVKDPALFEFLVSLIPEGSRHPE